MRSSFVSILGLVGLGAAQTANLTATLASSPDLSNLTALLSSFPDFLAQLAGATNVTILAPSNDAFAKLAGSPIAAAVAANDTGVIESLVNYHILNGTINSSQITTTPAFAPTHLTNTAFTNVTGGQVVEAVKDGSGNVIFYTGLLSNSTVSKADIAFTGGIVHVIDTFLMPPVNISTTAVAFGLSSIAGALTQANLVDALDILPDVTVFVPSNEAFESIASVLANISTSDLASVLEYHVVNGTVAYSTDVANGTVPTLQGTDLTLTVADGSIFVNQAKVIIPNVLVSNGVVHVIDAVLNPNATSVAPNPSGTAPPAFTGASSASEAPFTSGVPTPTATIAIPTAGGGPVATASNGASSSGSGSVISTAAAGRATEVALGALGAGALFAGAFIGL